MPNFDGGHYFLTTLAPIRIDPPTDELPGSYVQRIQAVLEVMPTALQSPVTEETGVNSPFSESKRTHLCRFVVIDDAVYNGRPGDNAFLEASPLRKDPLDPKHVDRLPCPYLMFASDFDAVKEADVGAALPDELTEEQQDEILNDYFESMWVKGSAELSEIYKNCQDFDPDRITTPKDFAAYMRRCQVETFMSYNDYYLDELNLPPLNKWPIIAALLPAAVLAFSLIGLLLYFIMSLFGHEGPPWMTVGWTAIISAVITYFTARGLYRHVIALGQKPWPAAKDGDLPSVLKGVYLQQKFSDFAVANQGKTAKQLHTAFGKFLKDHEPQNVLDADKTQAPGVIRS